MKKLFIISAISALLLSSCGSKGKEKTETATGICEATCLKDTLKFGEDGKGKAYVYAVPKNCVLDTIFWGTHGMGTVRSVVLKKPDLKVNKDKIRCLIAGGNYAYLLINNCETGRGYALKMLVGQLAAGQKENYSMNVKAINNADPKFSVADNLVVTCDGGNLLIDDPATGKQAMMTFGKWIDDIDYNAVHERIDSVSVSPTRAWARVLIDGKWTAIEKNLEFK